MPQAPTTKLGLYKALADGSEFFNLTLDLLNNWDKIDAAMGATQVTSTTRPASAYNGQLIRETDTLRVYISNGTLPGSASFTTQLFTSGGRTISASGSTRLLKVGRTTDSDDRFYIDADGVNWWGSGSATPDTNMYRSAVNTLKTDDNFTVAGNLQVDGIGQRTILVRNSDAAITSDATVNDDTVLTAALAANAVYHIEVFANVQGTGGDFKTSWGVPSGATGSRYCSGPEVASTDRTNTNATLRAEAFSTEVPYGTNGAAGHAIREAGCVTTSASAGTWVWRRSQNTSNASATTVMAGTYAVVERLA